MNVLGTIFKKVITLGILDLLPMKIMNNNIMSYIITMLHPIN